MRLAIAVLPIFTFLSTGSSVAQSLQFPEGLTAEFRPETRLSDVESAFVPPLYSSSHASNLLLLRNGDLLCFWFSGTDEGESNVGIVMSRLPKGSNTWEKSILIDREAAKSYQNPVPYEADNGDIWLLHTAQTAGKGQADAKVMKTVSHDGGKTWSKPEDLFVKAGSYTRQRIVRGDNGELLLPLFYSTSSGITTGAGSNYSSVKVSKDGGKSWTECLAPESNGLVHMNIVKLGRGNYVSFFRSRYADHIFRSTSTDGCHWQPPAATALPNNNASIQATVLKNGHIFLAFNNVSGHKGQHVLQTGARAPLSVGISTDEGKTWKYVRDLEINDKSREASFMPGGAEEYSYPSVQQLPDGKVVVTYTYRRLGIKAVKMDEEWVAGGGTAGEYKPEAK